MVKRKFISIAAPAYNEEENLPHFCERVSTAMKTLNYDFEIVIAENGSTDRSLAVLKELRAKNPQIRYVSLSRNFGHQGGILAALSHTRGDAVISMDSDLQHPPELIPRFIAEWEKGNKVVNSAKKARNVSFMRALIDRAFYLAIDRLTQLKTGQADFRLVDRQILVELLRLPETEKFLRGLVAWLGFKQTTITYEVAARQYGVSKFRRKHLVDLALQGITSFSTEPLRMVMKLGLYLFFPSAAFLFYTLVASVLNLFLYQRATLPPGWATLSVTITLFGSIQLLAISILGEYIGKIYLETKARPSFLVAETSDDTESI